MTDLEKFIELYKSFGIELEPYGGAALKRGEESPTCIEISSETVSSLLGTANAFMVIVFNADGSFRHQAIYES